MIDGNTVTSGFKMTELGSLPGEWKVMKFEDCILKQRVRVGKVKQQEYKNLGKYPIVDQGQNPIAGYWDKDGDLYQGGLPVIIFGDHTRVFKFIDFPFVCGADGTKVLLPNTSLVLPRFFYFALSHLKIPSRGYNRHYRLLKQQQIPLPPFPEQEKIAAVLSAVQEAKEKTEEVIKATKELKKSLMKHLFTYGPVSLGEAENVPLKETEIGLVPEDWEVVRLGDFVELITKGSSPKWQGFEYRDRGIVFLRSQNVGLGKLELTDVAHLPDEFNKKEKKSIIHKNDLLINIVGASIGRAAIANEFAEGGNLNQAIAIVRLKKELEPTFVMNFLLTNRGQLQLHTQKKEIARANLSLQDISNLLVPYLPVLIQNKIAHILSIVNKKIEVEENKKKALEDLFKTLLNNLMTGKIPVNNLNVAV